MATCGHPHTSASRPMSTRPSVKVIESVRTTHELPTPANGISSIHATLSPSPLFSAPTAKPVRPCRCPAAPKAPIFHRPFAPASLGEHSANGQGNGRLLCQRAETSGVVSRSFGKSRTKTSANVPGPYRSRRSPVTNLNCRFLTYLNVRLRYTEGQ